jgi:hypothetical protein
MGEHSGSTFRIFACIRSKLLWKTLMESRCRRVPTGRDVEFDEGNTQENLYTLLLL